MDHSPDTDLYPQIVAPELFAALEDLRGHLAAGDRPLELLTSSGRHGIVYEQGPDGRYARVGCVTTDPYAITAEIDDGIDGTLQAFRIYF